MRKPFILLACLCGTLVFVVLLHFYLKTAKSISYDYVTYMSSANNAYLQGDYMTAHKLATVVIQQAEKNKVYRPEAYQLRALVYEKFDKPEAAYQDYQTIIDGAYPDMILKANAYTARAQFLKRIGDSVREVEDWEQAIEMQKGFLWHIRRDNYERGEWEDHYRLNDIKQALATCSFDLGQRCSELDLWDKAENAYNTSKRYSHRYSPTYIKSMFYKADIYFTQKNWEQAIKGFENLLEKNDGVFLDAYMFLSNMKIAYAKAKLGDKEKACKIADEYTYRRVPKGELLASCFLLKAHIYELVDKPEKAIPFYKMVKSANYSTQNQKSNAGNALLLLQAEPARFD